MGDTVGPAVNPDESEGARCTRIGRFVAKDGCFALQQSAGLDVWLEVDPVPLHMLDDMVEITGRSYGANHIWVEAIGPVRSLS